MVLIWHIATHDSANLAARVVKQWQETRSMGGWQVWGMRSFLPKVPTRILSKLSARWIQWRYFVKAHSMALPHRLDKSTGEYQFILVEVDNFWFVNNYRDIQNDFCLLRKISISVCSLLYLLKKNLNIKNDALSLS